RKPDDISYELDKNETRVVYHLGTGGLAAGEHSFGLSLKRDGNIIAEETIARTVYEVKDLKLLFVKYTDIAEEHWSLHTEPVFSWFGIKGFLRGIDLLKRVFPVASEKLSYRFLEVGNPELLLNLDVPSNRSLLRMQVRRLGEDYATNSGFNPERSIGLVNIDLRPEGLTKAGWAPVPGDSAVTLFNKDDPAWGILLAHELGHTFGQVPKGKPNYFNNPIDGGDNHSENSNLINEKSGSLIWNSINDKLLEPQEVGSIMYQGGSTENDFFESQSAGPDGEDLEYRTIFRDRNPEPSFQALSLSRIPGEQQFVAMGWIGEGPQVSIETAYLTDDGRDTTPVARSDLKLVFLDVNNQVLSESGFELEYSADDPESASAGGTFYLVRPYPEGVAQIQIRLLDQVLAAIVPSDNPPIVTNVQVTTREFGPYTIEWDALDPDGDELNYGLRYSADDGQTYSPIATGLGETAFTWHHTVIGGSANAMIQVVASDGFHRATEHSALFQVPTKGPVVSILAPEDGAKVLEGSAITLRGAAFDPEDGVLGGDSLVWAFDGVEVGSQDVLRTGERSIPTPGGPVSLPVEIGLHHIALTVKDSSGKEARSEIDIEVVADTDRDGKSDLDELRVGADPLDPYVRPSICGDGDLDPDEQCDDGNTAAGDGCNAVCEIENINPNALCRDRVVPAGTGVCVASLEDASVDNGSSDPNGDEITLVQVPPGPYPLGTTDVTLTATDDRNGSASCMAKITVVDQEAPVALCNSPTSISPKDAPISFSSSANDNCQADSVITAYDCYSFTKKGRRIDKTESCVVQIETDTLTILDSGGVGDNITWVSEATDSSGNQTTESCAVTVISP
ncbi:hypothetical protein ACFL3A_10990, partial [Pseudomonadota bacterium]